MDKRVVHITGEQSCKLLRLAREGKVVSVAPAPECAAQPLDSTMRHLTDLGAPSLLDALGVGPANPLEILVPSDKSRRWTQGIKTKTLTTRLPEGSFFELLPGSSKKESIQIPTDLRVLIESPSLSIVRRARVMEAFIANSKLTRHIAMLRLLEFADECCGSYSRCPSDPRSGKIIYDKPGKCTRLITPKELRSYIQELRGMKGIALARTVAQYVIDESGSPMESFFNHSLTLPPRFGGLSIATPLANKQLVMSDRIKPILKHKSLRPDLQWPKFHVLAEYLGDAEHSGKPSRVEDKRRMQDYATAHYTAFPLMFDDVRNVAAIRVTAQMIARELMKNGATNELYRIRRIMKGESFQEKQTQLVATLLPPVTRFE